ncbi:MAG: potassium transporter TrkA [Desulfuromonas sp.]|uniref:potassium channel family protein n=1 Tax=Desulfuromonas sp. TaxID=892 RepID=UPI000CC89F3D|nr:potassium channel family protein [Desulfuromonas sp.]PLX82320.1 MAG: potassium transporter TrkA [Desulfuromonas sp.]
MKFFSSQLMSLLFPARARPNIRALISYSLLLVATVALFAVGFHLIMYHVEGQEHSWVTGVYWALTVMTTLGFGDITFHSDVGRLFSIVVLLTGVVLLLIVLPFVFIRFFYAPWMESRMRFHAPRAVPPGTRDHVILCGLDSLATALRARLQLHNIPHFVIEPDPVKAAQRQIDGVPVVTGRVEDRATYEALQVEHARMVVANCSDTINTNITLTIRDLSPHVPIAAVAEHERSIDLLELTGSNHVLPLKLQLGEHLANRVNAGHLHCHVVGRLGDLLIAEFPVHNTPLVGRPLRDVQLRESFGLNVVAVWERGRMVPVTPDTLLVDGSFPVVMGTEEQITELDTYLVIYNTNFNPVLVVGGGKVGCATTQTLRSRGVTVHMIEREESLRNALEGVADKLFIGNAADRELLMGAGLADAPSVLLTTNDDAMNIYLAVYYRRLNPKLRVISRITHERNIEAIHRAGADFVLSYPSLGAEAVMSLLQRRESVILGEGFDLFYVPTPAPLAGQSLASSHIRSRTGLNVLALRLPDGGVVPVTASTVLEPDCELVMLGSESQRQSFTEEFR